MNIEKRVIEEKQASVLLRTLVPSNVFHFATLTFDEAIAEDAVYMVVQGGKESRVQIVGIKDGLILQRDDTHKVCRLNASMVLNVII